MLSDNGNVICSEPKIVRVLCMAATSSTTAVIRLIIIVIIIRLQCDAICRSNAPDIERRDRRTNRMKPESWVERWVDGWHAVIFNMNGFSTIFLADFNEHLKFCNWILNFVELWYSSAQTASNVAFVSFGTESQWISTHLWVLTNWFSPASLDRAKPFHSPVCIDIIVFV